MTTAVRGRRLFGEKSWYAPGFLAKVVFLAVMVGLVVYAVPQLIEEKSWVGLGLAVAAAAVLVWVYTSRKHVPLKYLAPGTILLIAFQLYPVLYTVSTAVTNYGDGHLVSKESAITSIEAASVQPIADSSQYQLSVATKGNPNSSPFVYFATAPDGTVYKGTTSGLKKVSDDEVTKPSKTGRVTAAKGYTILTPTQVNSRSSELQKFAVPVSDGAYLRNLGVTVGYVGKATVTYDSKSDTLTDNKTHLKYKPKDGYFVATNGSGQRFDTGWKTYIGFANVSKVFGNADFRGPIVRIFLWTLMFALLSVALTFALGLLLAITLDHPSLRGRKVYRSLMLLPYAIPSFIALLVWQSMYNQDFGLLNRLLHLNVDWFGNAWTARFAIVLANLWLGFPYMFLICTGILQSIPAELKEAARTDGASAWQAFRQVTLPLLMVGVTPLLIASFALNFNNYNAIKLITDGGPFPTNNSTAGETDILISYTFRIAFGGQGAQYGLAATISVLIFVVVAAISFVGFRRTRNLEETFR